MHPFFPHLRNLWEIKFSPRSRGKERGERSACRLQGKERKRKEERRKEKREEGAIKIIKEIKKGLWIFIFYRIYIFDTFLWMCARQARAQESNRNGLDWD